MWFRRRKNTIIVKILQFRRLNFKDFGSDKTAPGCDEDAIHLKNVGFQLKPVLLPTSPHFHGPLCLTGDVGAAAVAAAGALLLGLCAVSAVSRCVNVQLPQRPWPRPPAVTGDQ